MPEDAPEFEYKPLGTIAYIGHDKAVLDPGPSAPFLRYIRGWLMGLGWKSAEVFMQISYKNMCAPGHTVSSPTYQDPGRARVLSDNVGGRVVAKMPDAIILHTRAQHRDERQRQWASMLPQCYKGKHLSAAPNCVFDLVSCGIIMCLIARFCLCCRWLVSRDFLKAKIFGRDISDV